MKRSVRLLIAVALTLLLVAVSASVWADFGRQGTVPIPPRNYPGSCNDVISFNLGYVYSEGAECRLNVKLVKDPAKKVGPALTGWKYLFTHAIDVKLVQGEIDSVLVCVPLTPNWEDKVIGETINWYRWNEDTGEWEAITTTIQDGTPKMICGNSDEDGIFSLQGK